MPSCCANVGSCVASQSQRCFVYFATFNTWDMGGVREMVFLPAFPCSACLIMYLSVLLDLGWWGVWVHPSFSPLHSYGNNFMFPSHLPSGWASKRVCTLLGYYILFLDDVCFDGKGSLFQHSRQQCRQSRSVTRVFAADIPPGLSDVIRLAASLPTYLVTKDIVFGHWVLLSCRLPCFVRCPPQVVNQFPFIM